MHINLRKANALSKALLDEARKLPLNTLAGVSVYNTTDLDKAMEAVGVKMRQNLADAQALLEAGYKLRGLMGAAFQSSGISDLLTEKALLDAREKLIVAVTTKDHQFNSASEVSLALPRLGALKEALTNPTTSRHSGTDVLNVRIPETAFAGLDDELRTLRRRKADIADSLLGLNTTTTIQVPTDIADLATRYKVA